MSDLISKKAVMEELLAIQDVTYMSTCLTVDECKGKRWMIARALNAVKDAPTVDAVEVVRCKDCKYSTPDIMSEDYIACWERNTVMPNDGFCSYGKRKEVSE